MMPFHPQMLKRNDLRLIGALLHRQINNARQAFQNRAM
jgi:hypothetical protein